VKEERKNEQETVIDQRMFGVGANGQSRILEEQRTRAVEA